MNEVIMGNKNEIANRTPIVIAAEINSIKEQTRKMFLYNSIEIGRRLTEARSMVPHGEWGAWLEKSVEYSKSTANNLMRIFDEYGAYQLSLFGGNAKSQALGDLSYTQAVVLLGLPEEEREPFIAENDIDNMSTRELKEAVKERDQALKEKNDIELKLKEAEKFKEKAEMFKNDLKETRKLLQEAQANGDKEKVSRLQSALAETDVARKEAEKKIQELEQQLKEKPIDVPAVKVVEKVPEEIERELQELRTKVTKQSGSQATVKYSLYFEELVKNFKSLLGSLAEIETTDPEEYQKYKNAVAGLISKMSERL